MGGSKNFILKTNSVFESLANMVAESPLNHHDPARLPPSFVCGDLDELVEDEVVGRKIKTR